MQSQIYQQTELLQFADFIGKIPLLRDFVKPPRSKPSIVPSSHVQVTIFDVLRQWAEKQLEGFKRMSDLFQKGFMYLLGTSGGPKMGFFDDRRKGLNKLCSDWVVMWGLDKPALFYY